MRFTQSKLNRALSIALLVAVGGASSQVIANSNVTTLEKTKLKASKNTDAKNQTELDSVAVSTNLMQDINDVADYIPGVEVAKMGRFGNNGFNIRGMEGDRIALTVDGLTQGETLDPPGFAPYEYFRGSRNSVEIEHMKSIQIVKGASSVSSGTGALGGAVMFTTMSASDFLTSDENQLRTYAKLGYDDRDQEAQATVGLASKLGGWETLLMYTKRSGSELENHSGSSDPVSLARELPDPVDYSSDALLFKSQFAFNDQHEVGVVVEYHDTLTETENLSRTGGIIQKRFPEDEQNRARYGAFYYLTLETAIFDELDVSLDYQDIFTSGVTNMHYLTCQTYEGRRCLEYGAPFLRQEQREFTQETSTLKLDFSKSFDTGSVAHNLVYGSMFEVRSLMNEMWDHRYNTINKEDGYRPLSRPGPNGETHYPQKDATFIPETDVEIWNFYLKNSFAVNEQLDVTAGVRYDNYTYKPELSDTFQDDLGIVKDFDMSAFTWQLSAIYNLAPEHSVSFDVGTGFRAPSVQQVYYGSRGAADNDWNVLPNYDLGAEKATNFEFAYKWQTDNSRVKVSVFNTNYDDFIENVSYKRPVDEPIYDWWTQTYIYEDSYVIPENVGKSKVQGLEIDSNFNLDNGLTLRASYSHSKGEHDDGDPMLTVSPNSALVSIGYDSKSFWRVVSQVRFQDAKKAEDAYETNARTGEKDYRPYLSDSWTVVDLIANFDVTDNVYVNIAATNIFDEEYYNWQSVRGVNEGRSPFRGGVQEDGIKRYTQPGRSFSANVVVRF